LEKVAKKELLPMQPGDVYTTYSDSSDLIELFGYYPKTNLDEGIKHFIDWFNKYYNGNI
jgi:UDP-glucuronate 4-epimerase